MNLAAGFAAWVKSALLCGAIFSFGCAQSGLADDLPLPPRRPAIVQPPPTAAQGAAGSACAGLLRDKWVEGDLLPDVIGADGCGIGLPLLLKAILLENGNRIPVAPPALMRCTLAATLAQWVRADVVPALEGGNLRLTGLASAGGYECRGRNRVASAVPSAHGHGNAIDISAFAVTPGPPLAIASQNASRDLFQKIRQSACARFMTVLGPGSDGLHETHMHLDMQERRSGTHFCQWQIK